MCVYRYNIFYVNIKIEAAHPKLRSRCAFVFYATRSAGEDACEVETSRILRSMRQETQGIQGIQYCQHALHMPCLAAWLLEVLDNQYKIRSDASQPIVVRWSKDWLGASRYFNIIEL